WVSDYPFLQRNVFVEVSNRIRDEREPRSRRKSRKYRN
ncbi:MAG TPA: phosphate ABC transporter permease, partial [Cyanobacteria bacterium UBA11049]|nr:phosphate ABC transporter permease [Cyanobacteria bacterium UBA11049]